MPTRWRRWTACRPHCARCGRSATPRAPRAIATGVDLHGEPVTIEGTELLARCVQHETDHLDGILFIDRLDRKQRKLAMQAIREAEWFGLPKPEIKLSPHPTARIS